MIAKADLSPEAIASIEERGVNTLGDLDARELLCRLLYSPDHSYFASPCASHLTCVVLCPPVLQGIDDPSEIGLNDAEMERLSTVLRRARTARSVPKYIHSLQQKRETH